MDEHGVTISFPPNSDSSMKHTPHTTIHSSSHQQQPPSTIDPRQPVTPPSKRSRGRPLGSKNKPKFSLMFNPDTDQEMKPIIIEVPIGFDVVGAVIQYAQRHQVNITVLSASGIVSNVTLCHSFSNTPAFTLHGPFTLMSLTGTYMNNTSIGDSSFSSSSSDPNPLCSFKISLSESSGQNFIGIVGGKVVAANEVIVVATIFKNPEIHKAKVTNNSDEGNNSNNNSNADNQGGHENLFGFDVANY
ncbi:AT-hook motif nuclear-localized protein 28-like [Abrus precatorius]|uniref:AT-hook motif nuclear-localized protein 28-like n=1 Tax=Abrus precatorius TaxID=3816 RepID=A0A8B8KN20_ABRPR|nr:AT-hook motif nuclear-localized protein 28-like [Abrus precatorius]